MTAKTNSERQAALRQRRAAEGLTEVRGVYLPQPMHKTLKEYAKKLLQTAKYCGNVAHSLALAQDDTTREDG